MPRMLLASVFAALWLQCEAQQIWKYHSKTRQKDLEIDDMTMPRTGVNLTPEGMMSRQEQVDKAEIRSARSADASENVAQLTEVNWKYARKKTVDRAAASQRRGSPGKFEHDINLAGKDIGFYIKSDSKGEDGPKRQNNAQKDLSYRWAFAEVPYVIEDGYTSDELGIIAQAILGYYDNTIIRFVPRTNQTYYLKIQQTGYGCWSYVGNIGQFWPEYIPQTVSLDSGVYQTCIFTMRVQHELMHALGFWHEQSRPDRDNYVNVEWANVEVDREHNFLSYTTNEVTTLNLTYDFYSLMHYGLYDFSAYSLPTMTIKSPFNKTIDPNRVGEVDRLSELDISKLNKYYTDECHPFKCKPVSEDYFEFRGTVNDFCVNERHTSIDEYFETTTIGMKAGWLKATEGFHNKALVLGSNSVDFVGIHLSIDSQDAVDSCVRGPILHFNASIIATDENSLNYWRCTRETPVGEWCSLDFDFSCWLMPSFTQDGCGTSHFSLDAHSGGDLFCVWSKTGFDHKPCASSPAKSGPRCHAQATCNNRATTHKCDCNDDFTGNGTHCEEIACGTTLSEVNISTGRLSSDGAEYPCAVDLLLSGNVFDLTATSEKQTLTFNGSMYLNCIGYTWRIRGEHGRGAGGHVLLTVNHFDIEDQWNCGYDEIVVYDGDIFDKCFHGRYCGASGGRNYIFKQWEASTNMATVVFRSDEWETRTGFQIEYQEACGNLNVPSDHLTIERSDSNPSEGTVKCDPGFILAGSGRKSTCTAEGVWDYSAVCKPSVPSAPKSNAGNSESGGSDDNDCYELDLICNPRQANLDAKKWVDWMRKLFGIASPRTPCQFCRSGVVYLFSCGDCQATYIEQTMRHLHTRLSEHLGVSPSTDFGESSYCFGCAFAECAGVIN